MREYVVTIRETLETHCPIEAGSYGEAIAKAKALWNDGYFILDADSFQDVEFSVIGDEEND